MDDPSQKAKDRASLLKSLGLVGSIGSALLNLVRLFLEVKS